ncbi:hypothetical protein CEXT_630071 [Caerostris extrusa]|uniref:Uncharacterized protein n=1 Tax=Caerostris extrusa TaxID=172846 RepID=A0AAV4MJ38_CAEEX|nr:hypothetical protein CEXT_630071 [Caerostris extrusa]
MHFCSRPKGFKFWLMNGPKLKSSLIGLCTKFREILSLFKIDGTVDSTGDLSCIIDSFDSATCDTLEVFTESSTMSDDMSLRVAAFVIRRINST